ncbi:MAG TPA: hypothetical protein VGU45_01770 [Microvirga sp.]|jgi:hypothetical protein|nr:hypothetical protein [Microvirga sp.]
MQIATLRFPSAATLLLGLAVLCAAMLALPGQTITTRYLPDLFRILDGAYRVSSGLVPHRDFHTPLGPLTAYIPAAGYGLTGSYGAAMPVGMALLLLAVAPAVIAIVGSRLQPVLALLFGAFLLLVLAVPINLGEGVTSLTFAKFYNRIGWVALGALLVMYLKPAKVRAGQDMRDALAAAFLTLVMVYTKATYGVVALGFLAFMLFDKDQRRWAVRALFIVAVAALLVEVVWRSHASYAESLMLALDVSGALRGSWGQILDHILVNFADFVLVGLIAIWALRRTRSLRDAVFYAGCAALGFLLINQNFQAWGIVTLHAAAAVAAETLLRRMGGDADEVASSTWSPIAGTKLLFAAIVLPTVVHCTLSLGLHAGAAVARAGEALPIPHLDRVRLANLWTWGDHGTSLEYLAAVAEGVNLLKAASSGSEPVLVLDIANPFALATDRSPARGETPWLQWERTVGPSASPRPEILFAQPHFVLEPKPAPGSDAAGALASGKHPAAAYAAYLGAHFEIAAETGSWKLHRRRAAPVQTSCRASCTAEPGPL